MSHFKSPLITVLMPSYNSGSRIVAAVQSIINQTFCDWHLLVLDDGSTDGSINLIESFGDSRIKIIKDSRNRGLSYRLNQGIDLAKGKYIVRMDADDLSFPTRFQRQYNFFESHPKIDLLASRAVVFKDINFSLIGLLPFFKEHQKIVANPWKSIQMPHPTWMAKKSWFKRNKYKIPEVRRSEDQELLLRTYPNSQFHCLSDVLVAYRQGPFNLSKTWIARKSLLRVQIKYFFIRKQWDFLVKSMVMFILKIALDLVAYLPIMDFVFFNRMRSEIPTNTKKQFLLLIKNNVKRS